MPAKNIAIIAIATEAAAFANTIAAGGFICAPSATATITAVLTAVLTARQHNLPVEHQGMR